jgi:outer membrane immunogenic protein
MGFAALAPAAVLIRAIGGFASSAAGNGFRAVFDSSRRAGANRSLRLINHYWIRIRAAEGVMRRSILILCFVALVSEARAADYDIPVLRGSSPDVPGPYVPAPPVFVGWSGFYAGGQAGFSRAGVDFTSTLAPVISGILRDTTIEPNVVGFHVLQVKDDTSSYNVGAFAGFNTQWDDVVLGLELNYSHVSLNKSAADSEERVFINNGQALPNHTLQYDIKVDGSALVQITDLWTGRFRAGWVANNFMPYGFVGAAVARATVLRSVTITGFLKDINNNCQVTPTNPCTPVTTPLDFGPVTVGQNGDFVWGYEAGGGIDYLITPAVFARGEWEYIGLRDVKSARVNINTVRTALGVRF